jgi:hypothetical protein
MPVYSFALAALAAAQAAAPHAAVQSASPSVVATSPAPQAVLVAPAASNVLRAGTEVPLVMSESITTNGKKLRIGQRIRMAVASDVRLGSAVVIPAGSIAEGEVTDVRNKGMWGKSGRIEARALRVRIGDRLVRLSGAFDDKGVTGTAGVVAAIAFVPVAGFFVTGTSATIPAGAGVKAFLDEDLTLSIPQAQ